MNNIYIYYPHFTTLQCSKTRDMFKVEIETRLTVGLKEILPQSHSPYQCKRRNLLSITFYFYVIGYRSDKFMRRAIAFQRVW